MKISDVLPNLQNFISEASHRFPKNLNKIIVFGSYARGEAKVSSDLDLALVFDGTGPAERADMGAVDYILYDFDEFLKISLFCTNQTKIDTVQNKFDANYWIREEGKLIWSR